MKSEVADRGPQVPSPNPTPTEIKAARQAAGLTQTAAAELVHSTCRAWQQWEAGDRRMHPAMWELFRIKSALIGSQFNHHDLQDVSIGLAHLISGNSFNGKVNSSENLEVFSFCGYGNKRGMRQAATYLEENGITVIKEIFKEGQPSFEIFGSCTEKDANQIKCEGSLIVNKATQPEISEATAPVKVQRPRVKG